MCVALATLTEASALFLWSYGCHAEQYLLNGFCCAEVSNHEYLTSVCENGQALEKIFEPWGAYNIHLLLLFALLPHSHSFHNPFIASLRWEMIWQV